MVFDMASITLKDMPEDVHAQLKAEADANFRSLNQEALVRLQRSFDVQDNHSTEVVNRLISEALKSGPDESFTMEQFGARLHAVKDRTLARIAAEKRAA